MDQAALEHIRSRLQEFQVGDQFTLAVLWGNAWNAFDKGEKDRLGKAFRACFTDDGPFRGTIEHLGRNARNHRVYQKL